MWSIGNGRLVTQDEIVADGLVVIEGSNIVYAGPRQEVPRSVRGRLGAAVAAFNEDARGGYICPGFIDIHVHGGGGADVMDGDAAALAAIARSHVRHGTTGFLATTMTAPHQQLVAVASVVRRAMENGGDPGARILGMHLEGPYINPRRAGAQNPEHMRAPVPAELEQLLDAAGGSWRLVTLAPELPGAQAAIRYLVGHGVTVSMGHTAADFEEARQAIGAGASLTTHTFNAMNVLHHRTPGLLGAVLADETVWTELIADGLHVHPAVMRLLHKLKGAKRTVLVTDSMRAQGCGDGDYMLGDLTVRVQNGEARLRLDDPAVSGALAGSVLTMDAAVRRMVQHVGASLPEAVRMASHNPAAVMGLQDRKGTLAKGNDADLVVLDDALHVRLTVVQGQIAYRL